jgi:chromosome segregation ATPase
VSRILRVARTPSAAALLAALGCLVATAVFAEEDSDAGSLRARTRALESDVALRDQEIGNLRAELRQLRRQLDAVQTERDGLAGVRAGDHERAEEESSRARFGALELQAAREREQQQREKLQAASDEIGRLQAEDGGRQAAVAALASELAGLRRQIAARETALAEREKAKRAIETQSRAAIDELRRRLTVLEDTLTRERAAKDERGRLIEALRRDKGALEARIAEVERARAEERARAVAEQQAKVGALAARQTELEAALAAARREGETRVTTVQALEDEKQKIESRMNEVEKELAEARTRIDALSSQAKDDSANASRLATELAELRRSLAVKDAALGEVEKKRGEEVRRLSQALGETRRESDERVASLGRREQELREALAEIEALSAEGKEASGKASRLAAELQDLRKTLAKRDDERLRRSKEKEALEATGRSLRSELAGARRQNQDIARKLEGLRSVESRRHTLEHELQRQTYRIRELEQTRVDRRELARLRALTVDLTRKVDGAEKVRAASAREVQSLVSPSEPAPAVVVAAVAGEGGEPAGLRRELDVERQRRETLEKEVARLSTNAHSESLYRETWKALQAARAEVLVLQNRLAEEQQRREAVEAAVERGRELAAKAEGDGESDDRLRRLIESSAAQRAESDHLQKDLADANEAIVRLKGRLEGIHTPEGSAEAAEQLVDENAKLRAALTKAEGTVATLQQKAELAERLAEIVYGAESTSGSDR